MTHLRANGLKRLLLFWVTDDFKETNPHKLNLALLSVCCEPGSQSAGGGAPLSQEVRVEPWRMETVCVPRKTETPY